MFKDIVISDQTVRNYNKRAISVCVWLLLVTGMSCGDKQPAADRQQKPETKAAETPKPAPAKTIVFYGNSLTAGYGLDAAEAFPAIIQHRLDSLHLPWKVVNAGLSGETTAGGKSRIEWILRQPVDIFVLELGGNDGLRGIPVTATHANLQAIIDSVKGKYPAAQIILAGMQVPPNMGKKYATEFRAVFKQLAEKNNALLVPFLLEGVGGVQELNQPDGIHPTAEGHKIVAENVWQVLQGVL
jgi:acyl-CoA thioesterase I